MLQQVYEEPIVPIFIDHDQEVQAYYSRVEEITLKTPENPNYQAPYLPYPQSYQYPAGNYPQSYPGMPGADPQFNTNMYGYHNQYYGQAPAPQYNVASPYGYPYSPANYPPYGAATSYHPHAAYPPQAPPGQWGGHPGAQTNLPYPYPNVMPGNQNNSTPPYGWGDVGSLLPLASGPPQVEANHLQDRATASGRSYIMEETIHASRAQRNFNENSSLVHQIEIGWKI